MAKEICAVHKYALGDEKKRECFWCSDCSAWICGKCKDRHFLRFLAMTNRWLDKKLK